MDQPDTITVVVSHREELRAQQAEVHLQAKGSFLMTGDDALQKVKELAHVVGQLNAGGVRREEIALRGVLAERSNPILGPANPATYLLCVDCPDLDRLPELLVVLTAQRNVVLDRLVWRFPDTPAQRAKWLAASLARALEKARHIAASLGVKLLGVHAFAEKWSEPADDEKFVRFTTTVATPVIAPGTDRNSPLTFPLLKTRQLELELRVDFRVSAYE